MHGGWTRGHVVALASAVWEIICIQIAGPNYPSCRKAATWASLCNHFFFPSYQQIPSGKGHADANPHAQMSLMISRLSDDSRGVGEKSPKTRIDLCVCWGCCRNTVDLPDIYGYYE